MMASTHPKLLGVSQLCLQLFCSLIEKLILQDMETNGMDARRWPGFALCVPTGRSCDIHYTRTPCQASKKAAGKDDFFFTWCVKCVEKRAQVPGGELPV